jgi:hypothetical protein
VSEDQETRPPLFVIKGDASDEEVAALTAVLQAMAASAAAARAAEKRPRPEWSAPRRGLRKPLFHGPGGWRASGLPR